jgi:hypothetical protein
MDEINTIQYKDSNKNLIQEEIKRRLDSGNAACFSW